MLDIFFWLLGFFLWLLYITIYMLEFFPRTARILSQCWLRPLDGLTHDITLDLVQHMSRICNAANTYNHTLYTGKIYSNKV